MSFEKRGEEWYSPAFLRCWTLFGVCCVKSAIPGHDVAKVGDRRPRMPPQPCCHVVVARPLWCREGCRDIIIVSNLLCKWIEESLSQDSTGSLGLAVSSQHVPKATRIDEVLKQPRAVEQQEDQPQEVHRGRPLHAHYLICFISRLRGVLHVGTH